MRDEWDEEVTPEANTPDGNIPNSYVEDGIRHIIIKDLDTIIRYEWDGEKLTEVSVF